MSREYYSPLRYPGGKAKMASFFKDVFKANSLCDGVYVEPYAGGASVALSLLFDEYASRVVINDIDRSIYAFWYTVLNKTEQLCKMIVDTPVTVEVWNKQKQIQRNNSKVNLLELGFSTFFLNRTNRSGILDAGIIGGLRQDGNWKIDARFNKPDLVARIERIANFRNRIELHNCDAVKLIQSLKEGLPSKCLFYLDPPYYMQGKELYLNFYNHSDHEEIACKIRRIKNQRWILTYDNVLAIRKFYVGLRQERFSLSYSAGGRARKGEEIIIFSDNIKYNIAAVPSAN